MSGENESFRFTSKCTKTDPTGDKLQTFLNTINEELKVAEQTGGSYKQRGGVVECKKGSPARNAIRLAVLAAITGGTIKVVTAAAPVVAGVITGATACELSILGSSLAVSACSKYLDLLMWLNSEVLAGRLPFWEYAMGGITTWGVASLSVKGLSYSMWVIEKIVDIICNVPDFVWPSADPPTPEDLARRAAELAKAEAAAAAALREAAAAAAAGRPPAGTTADTAAVGGTGGVPTAPPPGVASQGGGSVSRRRHKKTRRNRKSHGRRRHRKTKSA